MRENQNTNNASRSVRIAVNGKKYLVRYKDIKEYMNLLIEDNILWGYKNDYPDEEIRDYQNSATLEFKQLRHAINQNPDIVLTLDRSTESFVVATDRNTGQAYDKHIPIDYVLADDDWTPIPRSPISETKPKKSGGVKQWLANHPEAREDLRMLLEKGNPKKEAIEEFREKYGVDDLDMPAMRNVVRSRIEKKKKQQTRKWFANHPEAYADLYILFANGSPAKKRSMLSSLRNMVQRASICLPYREYTN